MICATENNKRRIRCAKCFVHAAVFLQVIIWTSPRCFGIVLLANSTQKTERGLIMNRKREAIFMGISILAGLALSGPAAQAATTVTATFSNQPIYVDGQRIQMEVYSIHGNNFVKLRDIGRAVDFGVIYDAATNSVHIDSTQSYQEEGVAALSSPTGESVQATLAKLREQYPSRSIYPSPYISYSGGPYGVSNRNCAGWAILCSDAVFGNLP